MDTQPLANESLLGRPFDSYQNLMQISACVRECARQTSVAQPNVLELSRRETGLSDFLPEALITRYPTHRNDEPVLDIPVALPFRDKSFNVCLVTDVYEHIPREMRPSLLGEMLRVTAGLVLVACPNGNEIVSRLDKMVFDFIWGKYAERFRPLEQHVGFGTEPIDRIVQTLKAQGADRVTVLPANYVYRWIHLILIYFDLQHRNPYGYLFQPFNRVYNEHLAGFDYREPCYRYLIVIPIDNAIDIDALNASLTRPFAKPAYLDENDEMLVRTFREVDARAADQLRVDAEEIDRLRSEIARLNREIKRLKSTGLAAAAQGRLSKLLRRLMS